MCDPRLQGALPCPAQGVQAASSTVSLLVCALRQGFLQPLLHHCGLHLVPMCTLKLVKWLQCAVHVRRGCAGDLLELSAGEGHKETKTVTIPSLFSKQLHPSQKVTRGPQGSSGDSSVPRNSPLAHICSRSGLTLGQDAQG